MALPNGLTLKQERFCQAYVTNGGNASAAYRSSYDCNGSSEPTVNVNASKLLDSTKIALRVEELFKATTLEAGVTETTVVSELAAIAFSDLRDTVSWNNHGVTLKDSETLTKDQVATVKSVKEGKEGIAITFHDKQRALELLGKHIGMWPTKAEVDVNVSHSLSLEGLTVEEKRVLAQAARERLRLEAGEAVEGEYREVP